MNLELLHNKYIESKEAYYNGESDLTDDEFNIMESTLQEAGILMEVGARVPEGRAKHPHITKMLSLDKYQLLGETDKDNSDQKTLTECWEKYTAKNKTERGILSLKYDGIAINLIYNFGKLTKVITRGDGFQGMDVTEKFIDIFPQNVNSEFIEFLEIRCEAYMSYENFKQYDIKNGGEYKHVRNLVGGIFNDIDVNDPRKYHIDYAVLEVIKSKTGEIVPIVFFEDISIEMSRKVKEFSHVCSLRDFILEVNDMTARRDNLGYPTDGMVLSMNVSTHRHNGKYPDHAVSIKFIPPTLKSKITGFSWVLHKTGRYVPKIHIEPITVDGREITQMSGHNMEYLILHDLYKGTEIDVILSNDIIPMVGKTYGGGENFDYWSNPNDGVYTILGKEFEHALLKRRFKIPSDGYVKGCNLLINEGAGNPKIKKLKYYNFLEQFPIDGVSRKTYEKLGDIAELYETPTYIFSEKFNVELLTENGFGEKTAKKIVDGYRSFKDKGVHITNVIKTLGITGCGDTITEQWGRFMGNVEYSFESLNSKVLDELSERIPEIYDVVHELRECGVETIYFQDVDNSESTIEDTKFVILTGSPKVFGFATKNDFLGQYPNLKETKKFTEADFLITDNMESKSSKMAKAAKAGVEIRTYGDFES